VRWGAPFPFHCAGKENTKTRPLSASQIGKCGELLVQLKLLKLGIESSPLTTDAGIDLVAFSNHRKSAITIQVKANQKAKPAGGTGRLHLDWYAEDDSAADIFAFVDLEKDQVWLVETPRLSAVAQQHHDGRFHFFMSIDPDTPPRRDGKPNHDHEFSEYLFEHSVARIF